MYIDTSAFFSFETNPIFNTFYLGKYVNINKQQEFALSVFVSNDMSFFAYFLNLLENWSAMIKVLGPIYTKHQRQCCDNSGMTLAILFSLKTVESLENGLQTHSGAIPLISIRTESQASSQSCRSVDADAWCKRTLKHIMGQCHH